MARWLPFALAGQLLVGVPTLLISLVVAYGTYVQAKGTYRSIFDDCWITRGVQGKPIPVAACPTDWTRVRGR